MKVGDEVWLKTQGNMARGGSKTSNAWIRKVGKKYVYVSKEKDAPESWWIQIKLDNFQENANNGWANYKMYLSEQEILDEQEFNKLSDKMHTTFGGWGKPKVTLDQLRRMEVILDE